MSLQIKYSTFIYKKLDNVSSSHAASLLELTNGDIICAWFGGKYESSADSSHYYSRLKKGTKQWNAPELLWNVPDKSAGNPRLATDAHGHIWAILPLNDGQWCNGGTKFYYRISYDMGYSWSTPTHVPELDHLLGKNKPLLVDDDRILFPIANEMDKSSAMVILNPQIGKWSVSDYIRIPSRQRCIQPAIAKLVDGRLIALLRTSPGFIWKAYSTDGGSSWSTPVETSLRHNDSGIDLQRLADGCLLVVYNDIDSKKRTPLNIAISKDNGKTWSPELTLETQDGEFSYPAIIQSANGKIHVVYTFINIEKASEYTSVARRKSVTPLFS
jgi:predicted neuraminidase